LRCLERADDQFRNRVGIVCGSREFTYGEFADRCRRLATALPGIGLEPGDRVAFLSFNTHRLLEGYYGVVQARGIVMPLNVRLSPQEFIQILNHSGARVLCYEKDFAPLAGQLKHHCPAIERWVGLDEETPGADLAYEELIEAGRPEPARIHDYDENSAAELFYTSGSTGTPKGVVLTHRNLFLHALMLLSATPHDEKICDLHTIPLFHANGWGRPQFSTMMGFRQVMVRRFDPLTVFRLIAENRATDMCLVPTMANMLLNTPGREQFDLASLKRVMLGGAAASPELVERLESAFGCRAYTGYGLTETCPALTISHFSPTVDLREDRVRQSYQAKAGWPLPGCRVRVIDLYGNDVPRDGQTIGEVVAQGDSIMEGYYLEPQATEAVLHDGWFHTGDMAVWDESCCVTIVDRKKEIIISGGENISSIEVERAIMMHEGVLECAVVAAPDEQWGEVPAAYVVPKPGITLTAEDLKSFLETRLGRFKLPRVLEFSAEPLPKTGTGKIRKMMLKERFWAGREKRVQG
jgi:fatty-acyl-CoA synthase